MLKRLISVYPDIACCKETIEQSYQLLLKTYTGGGKVLLAGNGGSAADCDHIVGELMKGFSSKRPLRAEERAKFAIHGTEGQFIADHLQGALPAISLSSHTGLMTAFANDVSADLIFGQQVWGYGQQGDTLIGLSTSGNSKNVVYAVQVAHSLGMKTIGFTGKSGGRLAELCDVTIQVPYEITAHIQERHLPIYHALCLMLEEALFDG